jgi:hypothetical protein
MPTRWRLSLAMSFAEMRGMFFPPNGSLLLLNGHFVAFLGYPGAFLIKGIRQFTPLIQSFASDSLALPKGVLSAEFKNFNN